VRAECKKHALIIAVVPCLFAIARVGPDTAGIKPKSTSDLSHCRPACPARRRRLPVQLSVADAGMTAAKCASLAAAKGGITYIGLQGGNACFGGAAGLERGWYPFPLPTALWPPGFPRWHAPCAACLGQSACWGTAGRTLQTQVTDGMSCAGTNVVFARALGRGTCSTPCAGDASSTCGGSNANTILLLPAGSTPVGACLRLASPDWSIALSTSDEADPCVSLLQAERLLMWAWRQWLALTSCRSEAQRHARAAACISQGCRD
jgi:hypothetical protein